MQPLRLNRALGLGLLITLACATAGAQADGTENTVELGYAYIGFNTKSGDLTGPAGTTPAGVQADLKDTQTLALIYERHLSGPWSVVLQGGLPPLVKMYGAGSGAALGEVGSTRAWFPAVLGQYTFNGPWGMQPYLGAGVNYTFYSSEQVAPVYTDAFDGSGSSARLRSSWGPTLKAGISFPVGERGIIDLTYARYGIRTSASITTATPGFGDIVRSVHIDADPGVVALLVGYRF